MAKLHPPQAFDFTRPVSWPAWLERFQRFRIASKLDEDDECVQVATLIYTMGPEADKIFKTFTFNSDADKDKFETVLTKFNDHFIPKRNVIHERSLFHRRMQTNGESIEEFIRALHDLAEHCDFSDKDDQIRDRIVIGISDKTISEKLQMESALTLAKAVEIARQCELIKAQISDQGKPELAVNVVGAQGHNRKFDQKNPRHYGKPKSQKSGFKFRGANKSFHNSNSCGRCGKFPAHAKRFCPAKDKRCLKCDKIGHFVDYCWDNSDNKPKTQGRVNEISNNMEELFLGAVTCQDKVGNSENWTVDLNLFGQKVKFKIDSGADVSVMSKHTFSRLGVDLPLQSAGNINLSSPGGNLSCIGCFVATCMHKGTEYKFEIFVIDSPISNLLSRGVAESMGMIRRIHEIKNDSIFGELGKMKTDPVKIKLKTDAQPFCLTSPRRVAIPLLQKVKDELERMIKLGVICEITEPTEWCAGMVPVIKKNGQIRLCVDLKPLNKSVQREIFTLPTIDDIGHKLCGTKVFTTLDCSSSFWQIPLDDESAKLTTFITPFGRYYFKRLCFGLCSATEIFQRKLTECLKDVPGAFVDIDDVLVYGKNKEEHDKNLSAVLDRIRESNLKLNKSKCKFRQKQVVYQGQVFSEAGMSPDPSKVEAITELVPPTNVTELRQFLGMVNYLGRYLKNLSAVLKPISELLQNDKMWVGLLLFLAGNCSYVVVVIRVILLY